jgi:hypothetical protein
MQQKNIIFQVRLSVIIFGPEKKLGGLVLITPSGA